MRIVFMGSAPFSRPSLERLLGGSEDEVVAVVTQPPKPKGRGQRVESSPVQKQAEDRYVPVLTPPSVNSSDSIEKLNALRPDLVVVVAYGQILKPAALTTPPLGCINVHASLLPLYRGASPIQHAIASGDTVTGVTTMHMDEGMDTGDVILQRSVAIGGDDTYGLVHDRLAAEGAALLMETLDLIRNGKPPRIPQDHAKATYAQRLRRSDGAIDWTVPATAIHHKVRAFNPWPSCFCKAPTGVLKVLRVRIEDGSMDSCPGQVVMVDGDGPLVQCGERAVRLLEVHPEGKQRMSGAAYACGHRLRPGDMLA